MGHLFFWAAIQISNAAIGFNTFVCQFDLGCNEGGVCVKTDEALTISLSPMLGERNKASLQFAHSTEPVIAFRSPESDFIFWSDTSQRNALFLRKERVEVVWIRVSQDSEASETLHGDCRSAL